MVSFSIKGTGTAVAPGEFIDPSPGDTGQAHKPHIVAGLGENQRTCGLSWFFALGLRLDQEQSADQRQIRVVFSRLFVKVPRPALDGAQCDGQLAVINPGSLLPD